MSDIRKAIMARLGIAAKAEMAMDSRYKVGDTVVARVAAQGMKKGQTYKVTDISMQDTPWGTFFDYQLDGKLWVGNGHLVLDKVNASRFGKKEKFGNWFVSHTADLLRSAPYAAGEAKLQAKMLQAQAAQLEKYIAELKAIKAPGSSDPETRDRVIALHTAIDAAVSLFKREMPNRFSRAGIKAKMAQEVPVNRKFEIRGSTFIAKPKAGKPAGTEYDLFLVLRNGGEVALASLSSLDRSYVQQRAEEAQRHSIKTHGIGGGYAYLASRPGAKAEMAAEGRVNVDGVEYRVLPYQVDYFKADLAKFDDPKWRKQIVQHYLKKNYIIRASRPGAKATHAKPEVEETEEQKAGLKLMAATDQAVSDKIRTLIKEGKPQDQAVAIALDMKRRGEI
jgi:hypothetical protein